MLLTDAVLIDGSGADPVERISVRIDGRHIAATGKAMGAFGETVVDLSGLFVLPGLIDAHVHVGHSSDMRAVLSGEISVAERAADIFRNLSQTLDAGFTSVRDTGGIDLGVIRAVESGRVRGPRIRACGPGLCQCGGHGHLHSPFMPPDDPYRHEVRGLTAFGRYCDGPDDVRRGAREAFRRGASFLKLSVTGGVISFSDTLADVQFSIEEISAAVAEADARGTYVAAHAHNLYGVRNAVKAGVRCIEHGTGIDEATAAMMAERGVHLVPTFAIARMLIDNFEEHGLPPSVRDRVGDTEKGMIEGMLAAREAGVLVGSGSDLLGPVQDRRGYEVAFKARILGAMEAITSATSINAQIMGMGDQIGTLAPGYVADLIAVDFNPLSDPELFDDPGHVVLVIKNGEIVKDIRK